MQFPRTPLPRKWVLRIGIGAVVLGVLAAAVLIRQQFTQGPSQYASLPASQTLLPRQQMWKDGASSFLFGTNDTYEWHPNNIQSQPGIQKALKEAGFTMVRSFIPDNADDPTIEKRIKTIENIGATCLAVITNIYNTNFNKHLIQYLGDRCVLYEFGNEPDLNNISLNSYLKQWNSVVPVLRKVNPHAKFIGPVTYYNLGTNNYMESFIKGVKQSGVLPDAISYHSYPCWHDTEADCSGKATSIGESIRPIKTFLQKHLGKELPIGITEWNYDPDNPPPAYGEKSDFITRFSKEALASMVKEKVSFACQFDAASYSGYGRLDMFNVETLKAKPQFYAIRDVIKQYKPT